MKKIFTLFAAAAATLSMSAADFQLFIGDQPVTDGASYEVGYKLVMDEDELGKYGTVQQDADLFFHGDKGTMVSLEVELLTQDADIMICPWGECYTLPARDGSYVNNSSGALTSTVQSAEIHSYTDFDGEDVPAVKTIDIKVKATANGASTSCQIKLLNTPETGSIRGIINSDYIQAVAGNVLNYSVNKPTTLAIYAITGNMVARYNIANSGSVNLSALPKGLYIYTDGLHKGKVIVR